MTTDPLTVAALTICGAAWLLTAVLLTLDLLGRLPEARKASARAHRLQRTNGLVLVTMLILFQVAAEAHWARPARLAVFVLTFVAGLSTLVVVVRTAAMHPADTTNPRR